MTRREWKRRKTNRSHDDQELLLLVAFAIVALIAGCIFVALPMVEIMEVVK